jgi:hypothetical protein
VLRLRRHPTSDDQLGGALGVAVLDSRAGDCGDIGLRTPAARAAPSTIAGRSR